MRISDWSSDVCSSDLWTPWEVYLRKLGLARGTARSGSRDLRFTNYVQATQAAPAGRGVMLGWRSITGDLVAEGRLVPVVRSEEHTSELQSLMRISYAVFCLKKTTTTRHLLPHFTTFMIT